VEKTSQKRSGKREARKTICQVIEDAFFHSNPQKAKGKPGKFGQKEKFQSGVGSLAKGLM